MHAQHDVVGKCETLYAIHDKLPGVSHGESFGVSRGESFGVSHGESFKVSKVKDYRNCHDKVVYEQGLFSGISTWLLLPKEEVQ